MFRNTLSGLSKREKEVFDQVCIHLNGCMRRYGLKHLDGEEDQILIELWMDTFPYKVDEHGDYVMRTVREKVKVVEPIYEKQWKEVTIDKKTKAKEWKWVDVVVGGRNVEKVVTKEVRELDFTKSLVESTSVGIYKWRAEQLFINKCKYLFGDTRVRKMTEDKKGATETVTDAWGNVRVKAVYKDETELTDEERLKVSKRDLTMQINECDLSREGEDPIALADVAGTVDGGYEEAILLGTLSDVCDETEMKVIAKFMDGDSTNRVFKDFEAEGIKFLARQMANLKSKVAEILRPSTEVLA